MFVTVNQIFYSDVAHSNFQWLAGLDIHKSISFQGGATPPPPPRPSLVDPTQSHIWPFPTDPLSTDALMVVLKHATTLFSLSDHSILSREWRVIFPLIMVGLWYYNQSSVTELLIMRDTHYHWVSIVGSLRDREVACSASDRQGSNFEPCVWRTVSSQSSHHPQEVLLAQFSLYVHKGGLKPDSFHFIITDYGRMCFKSDKTIGARPRPFSQLRMWSSSSFILCVMSAHNFFIWL